MSRATWAFVCAVGVGLVTQATALGDIVRYTNSPGSFPAVTSALQAEFGTTSFPPLTETTQSLYQVQGSGPVNLTFRFKADTGSFFFQFGYYKNSAALEAIDTSTIAGKMAYAQLALAPGNATLIFDDRVHNPGARGPPNSGRGSPSKLGGTSKMRANTCTSFAVSARTKGAAMVRYDPHASCSPASSMYSVGRPSPASRRAIPSRSSSAGRSRALPHASHSPTLPQATSVPPFST